MPSDIHGNPPPPPPQVLGLLDSGQAHGAHYTGSLANSTGQAQVRISAQVGSYWGGSRVSGGASARRACAGHLLGPLLIRSPNPHFLHGPFPVGDVDRPPSVRGYAPDIVHFSFFMTHFTDSMGER